MNKKLPVTVLKPFVPAGKSPMCGNSICQDRRFMARGMPKLDDELSVSVEVKERRAASILFAQTIRRADGVELIRAKVRVACVDVNRMRPVQIPADLIPGLSPQ